MNPGLQAGLDHFGAEFDERADHVADHLRPPEQLGQRLDGMFNLNDLVIGGFNTGDLVDHGLGPCLVTTGRDEGNVVFAQVFADETTGIAGHPVDDDGFLAHDNFLLKLRAYMPIPPSTGRPAPVMKRD